MSLKNVLKVKRDIHSVFLRIGKLAVSFHNLKHIFAPGNNELSKNTKDIRQAVFFPANHQ
jgi:hypothetical protein